jgi:hypothetical protein
MLLATFSGCRARRPRFRRSACGTDGLGRTPPQSYDGSGGRGTPCPSWLLIGRGRVYASCRRAPFGEGALMKVHYLACAYQGFGCSNGHISVGLIFAINRRHLRDRPDWHSSTITAEEEGPATSAAASADGHLPVHRKSAQRPERALLLPARYHRNHSVGHPGHRPLPAPEWPPVSGPCGRVRRAREGADRAVRPVIPLYRFEACR